MMVSDKKNKGEWSELYVFLRLLADGKLRKADTDLNENEDPYYFISKIIQYGKDSKKISYAIKNKTISIKHSENSLEIKKIAIKKFGENAKKLLETIQTSKGTFSDEESCKFMIEIEYPLKRQNSNSKTDITIFIKGRRTEEGFSIKSYLGSNPTLFNASSATNLVYKIEGLNDRILEQTKFLKGKSLLKILKNNHCEIIFESVCNKYFEQNLTMVDSEFSKVLAEIVKQFYLGDKDCKNIKDLAKKVSEKNPCDKNSMFYEHNIKTFLYDSALGMTAAKSWRGDINACGGYIIVKKDGEIICYHLEKIDRFKEYLFNKTYIDSPSTTKYKFGSIKDNKIKLNFQIRLKVK